MLQSQFNLEHRLAELRPTCAELRRAQAARQSNRQARTIAGSIRALLHGTPASSRQAGIAAA